jgi:predicted DNA-binding protein with PD1-like motif
MSPTNNNIISKEGQSGRVIVARLKTGSDLYLSLQEIVLKYGVKAAVILSGVGLLSKARLRNCKNLPEEFPITDQNRYYASFEIPLEILGISGNISMAEGKPHVHAHMVLSSVDDEKIRVIGGHMIEGSIIYGFSEIIIMEITGIEMLKEYDPETKTLQLYK